MKELTKKRYFELLLLKKDSELSKAELSELLEYSVLTNNYLNWCFKEHYLSLLDTFISQNETIPDHRELFEFCLNIKNSAELIDDIVETLEKNLIVLEPYQESIDFIDELENLIETCEWYLDDLQFFDDRTQTEFLNFRKQVLDSIKTHYNNLTNYLNKDKNN